LGIIPDPDKCSQFADPRGEAVTLLYRLDAAAAEIAAQFGAAAGADPWAGGHIAPGQFAPVITAGREAIAGPRLERQPLRLIPRLWGVPPPPSAGETGRGVLTVRNPDSPFWIGNLRNAEFRCLVPATAFMEWGKGVDREGKRLRHWFACADQPLFAFAGVWKDSEIASFALLTAEPNAVLRKAGREAMPAILPGDPKAWHTWLHGDWDRAKALLAPYSSSLMLERAGL
jgi:putative SOS response-associated peptidase YedK